MVKRAPRRERGFTILEVLVAMGIMAIGMVGILALQKTATEASGYARRATEAAVLAEDRIEQLRTEPLPTAASTNGADVVNAAGIADSNGPFRRAWTIAFVGDLATISVTVAWDENDGEHAISFDTQRSR